MANINHLLSAFTEGNAVTKNNILVTTNNAILKILALTVTLSISLGCSERARFPDLTGEPIMSEDQLEVVANLDIPPGNISVAPDGRIFFSFMPEARPDIAVAELVNGEAVPFPDLSWQPSGSREDKFISILPLRVDQFNRLWVLDAGFHGLLERARIFAFDITTRELVHSYTFPISIMGLGSYANDFQVSPNGRWIYISDAGIVNGIPAIVVYDVQNQLARRVLSSHPSVLAGDFVPVVQGVAMSIPGIFTLKPGVDGMALSRDSTTLYYGGFTNENLYRINTAALNDFALPLADIASQIELVGPKTMSDGMTIDDDGNVYLTDIEHDAIMRVSPSGELETLFKTPILRWPDGFSFGPDNYIYVTCSALHQVFNRTDRQTQSYSPFQIFRFNPGTTGTAGH